MLASVFAYFSAYLFGNSIFKTLIAHHKKNQCNDLQNNKYLVAPVPFTYIVVLNEYFEVNHKQKLFNIEDAKRKESH